jgi:ATP-dependent Lon protease
MSQLDQKINEFFPGLVVRKDLASVVKGNAAVPSYVLEYLLGQYCATSDEESIKSGIETVKGILSKHYVQRAEADLIKSMTREKGRHKVIDKVRVSLNEKIDRYEATFANLGIKRVLVSPDTVKANPRLLVSGVWCIADIEYQHSDDGGATPWILTTLKPIQLARVDFDSFLEARAKFSTEEWIDVLIQTIGFNPEMIGKRSKLLQLARLIPYCERNYNVIELGPKGTGKSHIYSEFSPHGILLSGGEVTVPKLFVANTKGGQIGLVGYWDVVAFDEFAGKTKKAQKKLVDIMKNYMANRSFSRGIDTMEAEASMSFVGNTQHTVPYMLKQSDLFDDLPPQYHDSAFLDRLHFYIPGWEIDIIRGEVFSNGYGFVVDFLAEILRALRSRDYSQIYADQFELSRSISTRDRDGVNKTFSGLMKLLFPGGEAPKEDIEELLTFAIEGRKRVKDQLMRIDATYPDVQFSFVDKESQTEKKVQTLEEQEYPQHYWSRRSSNPEGEPNGDVVEVDDATQSSTSMPSVDELVQAGESKTLEFKSTLRVNQHTSQPDTRIELSCLKTIAGFLNTDGGTLVVGVTDEREPIGIEADMFQSEDKFLLHFSNLIYSRVGPEHELSISPHIEDFQGHRVLVVDCKPSGSAVFVKDGKTERFYVRSAAATRELLPSETQAYIQQRFK